MLKETILFAIDPDDGNFDEVPQQEPRRRMLDSLFAVIVKA